MFRAYCDGDMLVERGDYGKHMFIVANLVARKDKTISRSQHPNKVY